MAFELVDYTLRHAPQELTAAERLVLVVIAEAVPSLSWEQRLSRRTAWLHEELRARAGLSDAAFRKTLHRLANPPKTQPGRFPLEVRVGLGKDRHGRTQWTVTGRKPAFELPWLGAPEDCTCLACERYRQRTARRSSPSPPMGPPDLRVIGGTA